MITEFTCTRSSAKDVGGSQWLRAATTQSDARVQRFETERIHALSTVLILSALSLSRAGKASFDDDALLGHVMKAD